MTENKTSLEERAAILAEWEAATKENIGTSEFARSKNIPPWKLYGWRDQKRRLDKKSKIITPITKERKTIMFEKKPKTGPKFQLNYCCNCGCPLKSQLVAMNIED